MKITDDVGLITKEFKRVGFTANHLALRWVGEECIVLKRDDVEGTVLCRFPGDTRAWFPKSCLVEDKPEEPLQVIPDGTLIPVKTLRDEIAMAAMESLLFSGFDEVAKIDEAKLAEMSYKISDAMMEARKK